MENIEQGITLARFNVRKMFEDKRLSIDCFLPKRNSEYLSYTDFWKDAKVLMELYKDIVVIQYIKFQGEENIDN